MNTYLKAELSEKLFDPNPLNLKKTFFEIELFYLIRECVNRADLAGCADVGENGMMTGVSEYDNSTFRIYQELKLKYLAKKKITKLDLFEIVKAIIGKAFVPEYVDNINGRKIAQSIYNEIYKLEIGQRRKTLASDPFKLQEYECMITTAEEFRVYIDGRKFNSIL